MTNFLSSLIVSGVLAAGQSTYDPALVLARTRDKVLELTDRLPKYTCVQTVNRTYFRPTKKPEPGNSCDQFAGDNKSGRRKLRVEATDRLRLDIIASDGKEIFSWAGASRFDSRWVGKFIGEGPVGTGSFGTFLLDIFRNDGVSFEYQSATQLRGKEVLQYDYHVPLEASHYYTRKTDRNWLTTAFSGSLWVNPATEELERLTVLTSELPPETGACTADTRVDYQSVRLGTGGFLLPLENELHFLLRDGTESNSISTYSKCREYLAESTVSFGAPSIAAEPAAGPSPASVPIPDGLRVVLTLITPIDTEIAAAGDVIRAKVKNAVLAPGTEAVLISARAIVRGRIVRMEHRMVPSPHFLISISWEKIEDHNAVAPFFARMDERMEVERAKGLHTRVPVWLPPPGESKRASGWFIFPTSKDRYLVPAGYETTWRTSSAPRGPEAR